MVLHRVGNTPAKSAQDIQQWVGLAEPAFLPPELVNQQPEFLPPKVVNQQQVLLPSKLDGGDVMDSDTVTPRNNPGSGGSGTLTKCGTIPKCGTCVKDCVHCQKCGTELSLHNWKKVVRLQGKDGIFRRRSRKMSNWRCGNCAWVKPTILDSKITKLLNQSSGRRDSASRDRTPGI